MLIVFLWYMRFMVFCGVMMSRVWWWLLIMMLFIGCVGRIVSCICLRLVFFMCFVLMVFVRVGIGFLVGFVLCVCWSGW